MANDINGDIGAELFKMADKLRKTINEVEYTDKGMA